MAGRTVILHELGEGELLHLLLLRSCGAEGGSLANVMDEVFSRRRASLRTHDCGFWLGAGHARQEV